MVLSVITPGQQVQTGMVGCLRLGAGKGGSAVKNPPAIQELQEMRVWPLGLIPVLGISPGGGHGNPLQYSWLGNPMDRGAWQATVCQVTKSWTQLKWLSTHAKTLKKRWYLNWVFKKIFFIEVLLICVIFRCTAKLVHYMYTHIGIFVCIYIYVCIYIF